MLRAAGLPNCYTLTKHMAEELVAGMHCAAFPAAIVRPTIIGAVAKAPLPGYFGNAAGITSATLAFASGRASLGCAACAAAATLAESVRGTCVVQGLRASAATTPTTSMTSSPATSQPALSSQLRWRCDRCCNTAVPWPLKSPLEICLCQPSLCKMLLQPCSGSHCAQPSRTRTGQGVRMRQGAVAAAPEPLVVHSGSSCTNPVKWFDAFSRTIFPYWDRNPPPANRRHATLPKAPPHSRCRRQSGVGRRVLQ